MLDMMNSQNLPFPFQGPLSDRSSCEGPEPPRPPSQRWSGPFLFPATKDTFPLGGGGGGPASQLFPGTLSSTTLRGLERGIWWDGWGGGQQDIMFIQWVSPPFDVVPPQPATLPRPRRVAKKGPGDGLRTQAAKPDPRRLPEPPAAPGPRDPTPTLLLLIHHFICSLTLHMRILCCGEIKTVA